MGDARAPALRPLRLSPRDPPRPTPVVSVARPGVPRIDRVRLALSLLAVPVSTTLGLLIPMIILGSGAPFRIWGLNMWGDLVFVLSTVALVYYASGSRLDGGRVFLIVTAGTALLYLASFSLSFESASLDFFSFQPVLDSNGVMIVFSYGWPGMIGTAAFVALARSLLDRPTPGRSSRIAD